METGENRKESERVLETWVGEGLAECGPVINLW